MKDRSREISINWYKIHSIRFAGDIVLLAASEEELNLMLHLLDSSLDKFKLKMNYKKTKVMAINKEIITANNK